MAEGKQRPEPGVDVPGITQAMDRCPGCGEVVRHCILQGAPADSPPIRVNAAPVEFVLADGRPLPVWRPHDPLCKSPAGLELPGGQFMVFR